MLSREGPALLSAPCTPSCRVLLPEAPPLPPTPWCGAWEAWLLHGTARLFRSCSGFAYGAGCQDREGVPGPKSSVDG